MGIILALLLLIVVFVVWQRTFERKWKKNLTVSVGFERPDAIEGEDIFISEVLTNRKIMFLPSTSVKFRLNRCFVFDDNEKVAVTDYAYRNDIYTLLSFQRLTCKYKCHATQRGHYQIEDAGVACAGLFMEQTVSLPIEQFTNKEVLVYPRIYSLENFEQRLLGLMGTARSRQHLYEDPFSFTGIREYQPYDDRKRINWAASAKTGKLQVNNPDYTTKQNIRILLNFDSPTYYQENDLMEESIRLAASFADFYYRREQSVSLKMNIDGEPELCVERGHNDISVLLKRLSEISYDEGVSSSIDFWNKCEVNTSDCLVFISACYRDDIYQLVMRAKAAGTTLLWIVPTNQSGLQLKSDMIGWLLRR